MAITGARHFGMSHKLTDDQLFPLRVEGQIEISGRAPKIVTYLTNMSADSVDGPKNRVYVKLEVAYVVDVRTKFGIAAHLSGPMGLDGAQLA